MQRTLLSLLAVALVLAPMPAAADHADDPRFVTNVPEPTLQPGRTTELTIQLENDHAEVDETVETAFDVHVTARASDTPFDVKSGTRRLGSMPDGRLETVTLRLGVPADVPGGTYRIPLEVSYVHDDERKRQTVRATVRIEERARFVVDATSSSVQVGGRGDVSVTVTNVGERPATAASFVLESTTPDVRFGEAASASRFVGNWSPGETRTLTYRATVSDAAEPRNYTLTGRVTYEDTDGNDATSRSLPLGVAPLPEQTFAVRDVESTLRVGEEGELRGVIVNEGPTTVENAVVTLQPSNAAITATETEVAVGTLESGGRAEFGFDVEVTDDATAGPRQFDVAVRYRRAGERYRSDPLGVQVDVGEERPAFSIEAVNASFEAGTSGHLELSVTNTGDGPVSDLSVKLYTESPLSSGDDEAFVERLAPGESATVAFGLGVGGGALTKTYPVKLDVRYDDAEGDTHISETFQVPVRVTGREGGGFPIGIAAGAGALVAVLLGGWYTYGRQ